MALQLERLEDRVLLAASIKGKNLIVDGTAGADEIEIRGTGNAGEVEVSFDNGVTFETYTGVRNIKVNTGAGDDNLTMYDVSIAGNLTVKTGDGNDNLYLSGEYGKNVKVDMGSGDDYTQESSGPLTVGKNFTFKFGLGNDEAHYDQDMTIKGNVSVDMGDGDDEFIAHGGYDYDFLGRRVSIKLGDGDDRLELEELTAPSARVTLDGGDGDDVFDDYGGHSFGKVPQIKNLETVNVV